MEAECYPSSILPHSSRLFLAYAESATPLAPFYPQASAGREWMHQGRELTAAHRARLADLLTAQNERFGGGPAAAANLARLRAGASAVVTGQQVGLFGGPLYTLLKAATAIARARQATAAGVDTVPIFWLASEDHDFAEIAHTGLQSADGALQQVSIGPAPAQPLPVGGLPLGASVEAALQAAASTLSATDVEQLLRRLYHPQATLAGAFGSLIAQLFAPWGLIVVDAAAREFHALGASTLAAALRDADRLHAALEERSRLLVERGYHVQVLVAEQSSLLFLLDEHSGARLPLRRVTTEEGLRWRAGSQVYSTEALLHILQAAPERFSPNALLRPVFQDTILPTACYVGGAAEIAYFAQSAVLYEAILGRTTAILPRLSATLVDPAVASVMERHELSLADAFTTADELATRLGARSMPVEGKQALAAAGNALDAELTAVTAWMARMDAGLGRSATTAASKMRYQMNRLRRLAARHQLEKQTSLRRQAQTVTQAVYPGGHLQERAVAGVSFLAAHGLPVLDRFIAAAEDNCPGHRLLPL